MPRVRISDEDGLAVPVKVWVPVDLRAALRQRAIAARQPLSVFLREAILRGGLPRPVPAVNREVWQKTARVAADLNQITRAINSARLIGQTPDFRDLPAAVAALRVEVAALRAALIDAPDRES